MIEGPSGLKNIGHPASRPDYESSRRRLVWPNGATAYCFSAEDPEGLRGHQFDAAWSDEIGCAAVDKGANQPNVFVDPKSDESGLPFFSSGARDDLMQRRFLEAHLSFWRDVNNNPISSIYGGSMVDADRLYVYAWDARPFPFFPARLDVWADGENWETGHWLNGRMGRAPLDLLVSALCRESDVTAVQTTGLTGVLSGYVIDRPLSAREMIDPLADIFQFDMVETGQGLRFQTRSHGPALYLDNQSIVDDDDAIFTVKIAQESDLPTAFRLAFIDEGKDYQPAVAHASEPGRADLTDRPGRQEVGVELPAVMTSAEAGARARAILSDAGVMRETVSFALPLSTLAVEPGDVVRAQFDGVNRLYRVTEITDGSERVMDAVRLAPGVYDAPVSRSVFSVAEGTQVSGPPIFEFLDLPLMRDTDDPATPWFAAFSTPWPGAVSAYRQTGAASLVATTQTRAMLGRLESDLPPGFSGRWDRRSLRLRLSFGSLASRDEADVFIGANALCIETSPGAFEVVQFRDAALGADGVWTLSNLLRGQAGTEAEAALGANAGARIVVINAALAPVSLPLDVRDGPLSLAVGPSNEPVESDLFVSRDVAWSARGLKPLSPVHVRANATTDGVALSWIRRTRLGGDSWAAGDVPLAEAFERYRIDIRRDDAIVRSEEISAASFVYSSSMILNDFGTVNPDGDIVAEITQLSDLVGAGAPARIGLFGA